MLLLIADNLNSNKHDPFGPFGPTNNIASTRLQVISASNWQPIYYIQQEFGLVLILSFGGDFFLLNLML